MSFKPKFKSKDFFQGGLDIADLCTVRGFFFVFYINNHKVDSLLHKIPSGRLSLWPQPACPCRSGSGSSAHHTPEEQTDSRTLGFLWWEPDTNLRDEFQFTLTTLQTWQMSLPAQKATPSCLQFHTSLLGPVRDVRTWKMQVIGFWMVETTGFISTVSD